MKKTLHNTLICILFSGVVFLFANAAGDEAPAGDNAKLSSAQSKDTHLDKTLPREVEGLKYKNIGWSYNCMECHNHVDEQRWERKELKVEHGNIKLKHGNNRYCLNCHHQTNRSAFVDYDGSEIPEKDVVKLCAKCHGPKYQDWKAGVHGRQNGFWDVSKGEKVKHACIECHDPHSPSYHSMKPLPPLSYPKRAAKSKGVHATHE